MLCGMSMISDVNSTLQPKPDQFLIGILYLLIRKLVTGDPHAHGKGLVDIKLGYSTYQWGSRARAPTVPAG